MNRLTILLVFLFAGAICEIVVIKNQQDVIYNGHVLFMVSMLMWSLCAQLCSRVEVCKSINFLAWNKTCQINDAEPGESTSGFIESTGNSFVAASTFPQQLAGQCKGNDCYCNEACMPRGPDYYCVPLPIKLSECSTRNNFIHLLTSTGNYTLYIHLEDFEGNSAYAEYFEFSLGDPATDYTLNVKGYCGSAGDSLTFHNGTMFSTIDNDNDIRSRFSCARNFKGAWWYKACHQANLNGEYLGGLHTRARKGIIWTAWKGIYYSLKSTKMMIKRH
ncbi:Ryncolin-4,Fibrinogen C domain-containing protein 1-A,Techylectin-5B,Microfibril-associated glycoprotein 4,Ficolin-2,Ficolin-1,Fibrinogen C domain-containing protein 1-B,Fibrinogen C domain-containing protein 1 [Mytilus coruscus]|uniref:Fibrinogen C-terminal domain-containing protein n=1 Tax=Mytilus coruscus TaxID=42192 RepID=A0A6J7ZZC4_MYTCO|nr:Ryncolin-4,Fibrinogen C domain-containing protein 1-A,Techylectin-5B,Microfibril-associated glycoprotein 4,Ficolin-2,Ficolin-1,Fibrinogen C domain-containing protein 1-B,Fibrinogen C domain-containing protein 1 [Mytilus coruscus]